MAGSVRVGRGGFQVTHILQHGILSHQEQEQLAREGHLPQWGKCHPSAVPELTEGNKGKTLQHPGRFAPRSYAAGIGLV